MNDEHTARATIAKAIQDVAQHDDELDGAVLVGWTTIAEWMAPDGVRWLSNVDGTASGDPCPQWQSQGYLHNALFHPETFVLSDDDEED